MPRPILKKQIQTEQKADWLSASKSKTKMDSFKLDRILRKKRSKEYMEAIMKLDTGGLDLANDVTSIVVKEFEEAADFAVDILLGYVAKCNLGFPYEVHTLDIGLRIIQHYKLGDPLPNGMEKARGIAVRGGYAFIEVYADCCRTISDDGTVSVIK